MRNPADAAHKATTTTERQTWTEDMLRTFLGHVRRDRLYALWRLASNTGARRGELLALRRASVDLATGTVSIARNRVKGEGGKVVEGDSKTDAAVGRSTLTP